MIRVTDQVKVSQYFFISDGAGVECCCPFQLNEKELAASWVRYLAKANPARGPYKLVKAAMTEKLEIDWANRVDA
jgi:hypothetical protein